MSRVTAVAQVPLLAVQGLLLAVALGGAGVSLHAVGFAFRHKYEYPYWDMVTNLHQFFGTSSWLSYVVAHDNEHLPMVAKPLWTLDNLLFDARGTTLIGLILALTGLLAGLLITELKRSWGKTDLPFLAASSLVAANLFFLLHWENLIWPKQIHVYLSVVSAVAAGWYAASLDERYRTTGQLRPCQVLELSLLLVVSTFSFSYGAVAWIAVLLIAFTGRWPWRRMAIVLGILAAVAALYARFYNYGAVQHLSNPLTSWMNPADQASYIVHFLSYPVVALLRTALPPKGALMVGLTLTSALSIAALIWLFRVLIRPAERRNQSSLRALFLVLFAIGTAAMTGLGRVDFGMQQSFSSRYAIVQILFWLGLALAALGPMSKSEQARAWSLALGGPVVLTLLIVAHFGFAEVAIARTRGVWQGALALVNGVQDEKVLRKSIHPNMDMIAQVDQSLRARRWSIYSQSAPHWLGQEVERLFRPIDSDRCKGTLTGASDLGRLVDQSAAHGWAWDVRAGRAPEWIVLVAATGKIRGIGRTGWERPDVGLLHPEVSEDRIGWIAYIAEPAPLAGLAAFAILSDGASACRLSRNSEFAGRHDD